MSRNGAQHSALVLLSGGLDSLACVAFYRDAGFKVTALFVDYGQAAATRERDAAHNLATRIQVELSVAAVGGVDVPDGCIPGRNAMLLAVALMRSKRSNLVALGIHAGTEYPDCTPAFIDSMQRVFDLYTSGQVRVAAPFIDWTKSQIWDYLNKSGYPSNLSYSCELGLDQPCGRCRTCSDLMVLYAR